MLAYVNAPTLPVLETIEADLEPVYCACCNTELLTDAEVLAAGAWVQVHVGGREAA